MSKKTILLTACGYLLLAQSGYTHSHHDTYIIEQPAPVIVVQQPIAETITVENEPPVDRIEEMTPAPGENYAFQKGHWQWNGSWIWVRGEWVQRPHPNGVYVPGYWKKHHHHWEWVEPYWK